MCIYLFIIIQALSVRLCDGWLHLEKYVWTHDKLSASLSAVIKGVS